jgi:Fic family protein
MLKRLDAAMKRWIWEQPEWPHFRWNAAEVSSPLAAARLAQGRVLGLAAMLDPALSREATAEAIAEEGHKTASIEGEDYDLDAVRSSVARHLDLPSAGLPVPPRAVDGLVEVLLDATGRHASPLTKVRLLRWHASLIGREGVAAPRAKAGRLRGSAAMQVVSGPVGREWVHFEAPPRFRLEDELRGFLGWFSDPTPGMDGLIRAGLAHLWFVTLHPFEDGNGRIARAITDMAIAQDEGSGVRLFSLSSQIRLERKGYYRVLERTQRGSLDVRQGVVWFLDQVRLACGRSEATVSRTLAKARFWMRFKAAEITDRQRKVLNRLLDAGPGGFEGGMNNRKYMGLTGASRVTAYRELTDLAARGVLVARGGGRSTVYDVDWHSLLP